MNHKTSPTTDEFLANVPPSRKHQFTRLAVIVLVMLVLATLVTVLWPATVQSPTKTASTPSITAPAAQVSITDQGFVPASLQIKAGTAVVWTNNTATPHQVAADPYPSKASLPTLDSSELAPTKTYRFIFNKRGTYNYHDQLHPLVTGTVVVQ